MSDHEVLRKLDADDLIELVGVLRRDLVLVAAENTRLRAVVDAVRAYRLLDDEAEALHAAGHAVGEALDQLDATPTGEGT